MKLILVINLFFHSLEFVLLCGNNLINMLHNSAVVLNSEMTTMGENPAKGKEEEWFWNKLSFQNFEENL